jgi:hypothetical protein
MTTEMHPDNRLEEWLVAAERRTPPWIPSKLTEKYHDLR